MKFQSLVPVSFLVLLVLNVVDVVSTLIGVGWFGCVEANGVVNLIAESVGLLGGLMVGLGVFVGGCGLVSLGAWMDRRWWAVAGAAGLNMVFVVLAARAVINNLGVLWRVM